MVKKTQEVEFHNTTDKLKKDEKAIDTEIGIEKAKQKLKKSEKNRKDAIKERVKKEESLFKEKIELDKKLEEE